MGRKMKFDFWEPIKQMPPLPHSYPGVEFDITESEAAAWIASQPEVRQKMFDMARYHGVIQYDPDTGTWKGVDYED